jgi:hypothetical protein
MMENKPAIFSLIGAFALLIAVFVGVALICKRLLTLYIEHEDLRTIASLLIAAAVTLIVLHTLKMISQRKTKDT